MVDKTSLTEPEQDDAVAIEAGDVGFTLLTHIDTGSFLDMDRSSLNGWNLPRFGGGGGGGCCQRYCAPHQPVRLRASPHPVPDDVWKTFAHDMMKVKHLIYMLRLVTLLAIFFLWCLPQISPGPMFRILGEDLLSIYPIAVMVLFFNFFWYDAQKYFGRSFRKVVTTHQDRFAEHGVRLYYVEELFRSCWYGPRRVTSYVVFRGTAAKNEPQQKPATEPFGVVV